MAPLLFRFAGILACRASSEKGKYFIHKHERVDSELFLPFQSRNVGWWAFGKLHHSVKYHGSGKVAPAGDKPTACELIQLLWVGCYRSTLGEVNWQDKNNNFHSEFVISRFKGSNSLFAYLCADVVGIRLEFRVGFSRFAVCAKYAFQHADQ